MQEKAKRKVQLCSARELHPYDNKKTLTAHLHT